MVINPLYVEKCAYHLNRGVCSHEKNLSAKQYVTEKNPWFSGPHVNQERPARHQKKACQGSQEAGGHHRCQIGSVYVYGFPRQERLRKRTDFLRLSGQGTKIHTSNFILIWTESPVSAVRIGITVSGKVGNAVCRNRLKRLIREFYRLSKGLFGPADYSIIARKGAARLDFSELCRELDRALRRLQSQQC
jgi:ribonuclease P protein component